MGYGKDPQLAFRWYYTAAQDGMPKAMAAVAYYFVRGLHGVQDDMTAIAWYHKAARAGHVDSMTAYAWMLANGRGGQSDKEEAGYYLRKAMILGDQNAPRLCKEMMPSGAC
jgi:TPR repeat protein